MFFFNNTLQNWDTQCVNGEQNVLIAPQSMVASALPAPTSRAMLMATGLVCATLNLVNSGIGDCLRAGNL